MRKSGSISFGHAFVEHQEAHVSFETESNEPKVNFVKLSSADVESVAVKGEEEILEVLRLLKACLPDLWAKA